MRDLNDLYYFYEVVTHEGFSAASRRIGVPKGTLSKRVARLEQDLGVRLLERSTRRVRVTEIGRSFYEHCQALVANAEAAETVVAQAYAEPHGIVRVSCPTGLMKNLIADLIPSFLDAYPKVSVQLKMMNRRVDLVDDRIDIALRARERFDTEPQLIVRSFASSRLVFVMGPALHERCGGALTIDNVAELPTLSMNEEPDEDRWELVGPHGETRTLRHRPRFRSSSFDALIAAAAHNLGIALLPEHICVPALESGDIVRALPEWHTRYGLIHAVLTTRKGMLPAVRVLLDFLGTHIPNRFSSAPSEPSAQESPSIQR